MSTPQGCGRGKVVTEVTPAGDFWKAESKHQDYLLKHVDGYTEAGQRIQPC
jgi:peptide-methionine (S)-S-oxide reductase